ncbi:MAG: anti-sigma factor family protein [Thermodesulfobacteriota bacterium]
MEGLKGENTTCREVCERFLAWADGDLGQQERAQQEAHIASCRGCAASWERYRSAVELLRSLDQLPVPERILLGIRARLRRRPVWERVTRWFVPLPQRLPVPALAAAAILLIGIAVWRWGPWEPVVPERMSTAVAARPPSSPGLGVMPVTSWNPYADRILPGAEELLRPVKALEEDQERRLAKKAVLQDDVVLDVPASEELFNRIEAMVREAHGQMFLMGIRHRDTGRVVRSRMLIQVPVENYRGIVEQMESLGGVKHVFGGWGPLVPPPDRLRIRVLAVAGKLDAMLPPLQEMAQDDNMVR